MTASIALDLSLTCYKDPESSTCLYFWTELQKTTVVHVSPMFEDRAEAEKWYEKLTENIRNSSRHWNQF